MSERAHAAGRRARRAGRAAGAGAGARSRRASTSRATPCSKRRAACSSASRARATSARSSTWAGAGCPRAGARVAATAPDGDLDAALARRAAAARRRAERALDERYAYDLFSRNCITELVRVTDEAFGSPERDGRGARRPDRAGRVVRLRSVRVLRRRAHAPARLARRARAVVSASASSRGSRARSRALWPRARESTTLLSTVVRAAASRRRVPALHRRRVLAAAAVRRGEPDLGVRLYAVRCRRRAVRSRRARCARVCSGAFWSVPELAFQNVRKGSFEWVSAEAD